ncbi:La ribonucleoprotein [Trifolium repens]|nr:La ribonucleoprotein [Trifolium repens]
MRKTKKSSSTTSDSECCKQAAAAGEAGERETDQTPSASDDAPKLDDGFYEIETIRRKRLRKGEVQYLIKWRGWPETANTWEPLHNLQSVPDLIHAFEESLKSGGGGGVGVVGAKHHRKRTRHSQPPQTGISNLLNTSQQHIAQTNHQNHSNELKPTPNAGVRADNLAIHFQQTLISTPNDAQSNGDSLQTDRCTGAKRRKSSSVKRFKKEDSAVDTKNATDISIGKLEPGWTETAGYMGNNGHQNIADAKTGCNIVKIIKPIGYSASLSCYMQDVSVTFMALRSDGTEVMVDNKYLKTNNPLLLINFYEQHLRYNPTS